jgi:hypothetical protein
MIRNEHNEILITRINWLRIRCYLIKVGDLLGKSAAISFYSRRLPDGGNSDRNEQKELICFDIFKG